MKPWAWLLVLLGALMSADAAAAPLRLWYQQPAKDWESQALPLGNGRLGVMAFGGVQEDRFAFSDSTLWYGQAPAGEAADLSPALDRVRQLLLEGKAFEAQELADAELMNKQGKAGGHQALGDLLVRDGARGAAEGYERSLDLRSGLHSVRFKRQGALEERRAFTSAADGVAVLEWKSSAKKGLDLDFSAVTPHPGAQQQGLGNMFLLSGQTRGGATSFTWRFLILPQGGELKDQRVRGASSVLVLASVQTGADPVPDLAGLAQRGFERLFADHATVHRSLMERVTLDLGPASQLPTDERLKAYQAGAADPGLEALYFQYGRYLLLSSSRGGPLPANLQGVWNKDLEAPWNADYHININIQMNYWPANVAALAECQLPLFDWLESIRPGVRRFARSLGAKGMAGSYTTDAWGWAGFEGKTQWGLWTMGLAWIGRHFMEHWRYTQDEVFLRERAYPFIRENAEFLLSWLVKDPKSGKLVSGPSSSPENDYLDAQGRPVNVAMGPAMDQQIAWDCFSDVLEAAQALKIEDELTAKVNAAREALAPTQLGADGRLLEWGTEVMEADPGHRHISHLYGLHPGRQFSFEGTPQHMAAARKTLEQRLASGGGHTGWSRAWIINFWARLHDAEEAHSNLRALLTKSTLPNLFDTHPPFQIDGNFGGAAGMAEMLLQSQHGVLELMPALPKAWAKGEVSGLRARGGYGVYMRWQEGKLERALISATKAGLCKVRYAGRDWEREMVVGDVWSFEPEGKKD